MRQQFLSVEYVLIGNTAMPVYYSIELIIVESLIPDSDRDEWNDEDREVFQYLYVNLN